MTLEAELAEFFTRYAAALSAYDEEVLAEFYALPHVIVEGGRSTFIETAEEADGTLDALLADYEMRGMSEAAAELLNAEPLPQDAARARVAWRLLDKDGGALDRFEMGYTLLRHDGVWRLIAVEGPADGG